MTKDNRELEAEIRRADAAIRECERKGIDPVEALEKAVKEREGRST